MTDPNKPTDYVPTASVELKCGTCSAAMNDINNKEK